MDAPTGFPFSIENDETSYEEIRYEGYGPGSVAVIIDVLTDNRNRTASEIRSAFSKNGGSLGETGSLSFVFNRKGVIKFKIEDCSTQRNLNSVGIDQAIDLGKLFSESGLIFQKIYSSQWCRCLETAKLLKLGRVFPEVSLNSGFRGIYKKEISFEKLSNLLDELKYKDGLFLMVTVALVMSFKL